MTLQAWHDQVLLQIGPGEARHIVVQRSPRTHGVARIVHLELWSFVGDQHLKKIVGMIHEMF